MLAPESIFILRSVNVSLGRSTKEGSTGKDTFARCDRSSQAKGGREPWLKRGLGGIGM